LSGAMQEIMSARMERCVDLQVEMSSLEPKSNPPAAPETPAASPVKT
jgi:hypothetical protein